MHPLARPLWASRALTFAALVAGVLLIGMRAHYWFASRQKLSALRRARTRYRPAVRLADWVFSVIFATMAGLMLYIDRPGTAAPLLILAAVNVLVFLVVEPASEADAFPDEDGERPGGEPLQTGPTLGTTTTPAGRGPTVEGSQRPAAEENYDFALALYTQLRGRGGNVVFSPFSVRTAARMALVGARGDTAAQMRAALRVTADEETSETGSHTLLQRFQGAGGRSGLALVNALWTQEGQLLLADFREVVEREFQAAVHQADFRGAAERARQRINTWVAEQTRNRVRDLVPPGGVDGTTRLVLANAVWFKDRWVSQFDPARTREEPFYLDRRRTVQAALMHQRCSVLYAPGNGFQVVDLGYFDTTLSMLVLLPDERDGLEPLEARLSSPALRDCVARLRFQEIELFLPRFRTESGAELRLQLAALGMPLAFSRTSADFSGISGIAPPDPEALFISAVWHRAFVEVEETGTEAAAATAIAMERMAASHPAPPPPVPVFRADHPFLFAIRDRQSGVLLFLGRVADPTLNGLP